MLTDESIMPTGEYAGQKLANIPADYFLWLNKQNWCSSAMRQYIEENMDSFKLELGNNIDENEY